MTLSKFKKKKFLQRFLVPVLLMICLSVWIFAHKCVCVCLSRSIVRYASNESSVPHPAESSSKTEVQEMVRMPVFAPVMYFFFMLTWKTVVPLFFYIKKLPTRLILLLIDALESLLCTYLLLLFWKWPYIIQEELPASVLFSLFIFCSLFLIRSFFFFF